MALLIGSNEKGRVEESVFPDGPGIRTACQPTNFQKERVFMDMIFRNWRRGLVIAGLVLVNFALGGARTPVSADGGCCDTCFCWCHTGGSVCDSLGTGGQCGKAAAGHYESK